MAKTYYLRNTASDLGGGADFSYKLLTATASLAVPTITIAASATETSYAFTEPNEPGAAGASGSYTVEVHVATSNSSIECAVEVARVNSAGVVQSGPVSLGAAQSLGTTGAKSFTNASVNLGTWGSTDRLRVSYIFTNSSSMSAQSVNIDVNTSNAEVITPFSTSTFLTPSLFTDSDTLFAPTVIRQQFLSPGLLTNNGDIKTPVVNRGAVNLSPSLFTDTDSIFAPTIHEVILPGLFSDSETFFGPVVSAGDVLILVPSLLEDGETFFSPIVFRVTEFLTPALFSDLETFYSPNVYLGIGLQPSLVTVTKSFFGPTVTVGGITLGVPLFSELDIFYRPTLSGGLNQESDSIWVPEGIFGGHSSNSIWSQGLN